MYKNSSSLNTSRITAERPSSRSEESELRAAVQHAVIQLCAQEDGTSTRLSPKAIVALAELTTLYATTSLASDLEAFSTHAGRKTITEADVKLVARKSPVLLEQLDAVCQSNNSNNNASSVATSRKTSPKIDLSKPQKQVEDLCLDDSSSSSSDDDILAMDTIEGQRKKTAAAVRSVMAAQKQANNFDDSSSSDEDELFAKRPRKVAAARSIKHNNNNSLDISSDDDDCRPQKVAKKAEPVRRFRLQPSMQDNNIAGDRSSDDDLLMSPFHQRDTKPSKTQQMLANLSQDSLLSVHEGDRENRLN